MAADWTPYTPPGSIKDVRPLEFGSGFSWTGLYLGAQGGYAWGDTSLNNDFGSTASWQHEGWFGGGYAGFNWQLSSFVLGVEGDWNGAGIDGGAEVDSLNFASEIDSFASLRARAGWAADRWLFFVTGGWGWAGASDTHDDSMFDLFDADMTLDGWTVGGGLEHAFTDNVIGRLEYRHYGFDSKNMGASGGRFDTGLDTVSAGVSIMF